MVMEKRILIVDDEINSLKVFSSTLKRYGFSVDTARTAEDALELFNENIYNLVVTDFKLPGIDGESFLEKVKIKSPETPVILITAYGTIEHAVQAMKKGAYTYLTKPVDLSLLVSVVKEALMSTDDNYYNAIEGKYQFFNIIGRTPAMREVFSLIQRVGKTDANVLILGESGTGKELVARAIHYSSLRADNPFIPIDCTTIPAELIESELFGYEKGAFTCAYDNKIGLLEMADRGTIFFDEIGDLDLPLQKKLLRFIQEKEFYRLGGKKKISVDVRIIAATNRDLEDAVQKGEFRSDLYYRLNVITISMPPLRERKDDIPLLAEHFLKEFARKNKKEIAGIDDEVMKIFLNYDWPGNVRELENIIERAVILCPYDIITVECLPNKLRIMIEEQEKNNDTFNLAEIEKRIILKALNKTGWNQSKAAELLGISRKQLRTKLKNLGLLAVERNE